jgi:ABC-type antimicrobial peptide transport system permease subunit
MIAKLLDWAILISPIVMVAAVSFSIAVGVFFGYLPERKAARLGLKRVDAQAAHKFSSTSLR